MSDFLSMVTIFILLTPQEFQCYKFGDRWEKLDCKNTIKLKECQKFQFNKPWWWA